MLWNKGSQIGLQGSVSEDASFWWKEEEKKDLMKKLRF